MMTSLVLSIGLCYGIIDVENRSKPAIVFKVVEKSKRHVGYLWWLPDVRQWGSDTYRKPLGVFFRKDNTRRMRCPK